MQILILGAGYAGLRTALDLAEAKHKGQLKGVSVTLVDQNDYHQVITWLHDIAAAAVDPQKARIPLDRLLGQGGVSIRQATVRGIAPGEQRVLLEDGTALLYDRLVLALGSDTVWPPIAGLRDHALPMRWWGEAMAIREAILYNFALAAETSDKAERQRLLTIVVVGGGYTGCQLAGELTHWLPALADEYGISLFDLTLRQIEGQARLLPNWERRFSDKAERVLRRKGVQVLLDSPVQQIDEKTLTIKGKQPLPYGVLVWVGGVRAPKILQTSGFQTGIQGRAEVDPYLRAKDFPNTYVIGDCSLWMDGEQPLPATASHALRQGEYVARMLKREVNRQALARYEPTKLGLVVSLGGNDGIGTALGLPLSGLAAGILKEGIEAWYLSTIGVH
jgi:NADH dehydrogenase